MSKNLNRRAVLAGAATVPIATATALASNGDVELRRLWAEYLHHAAADAAALERVKPVRAAFDAEFPPCPDDVLPGVHWRAYRWLWEKHGLDVLHDAWNAAYSAMLETIAKILRTDAEGLFGIAVKLSALPKEPGPEDYLDAVKSVQQDIDRLIGTNFSNYTRDPEENP